MLKSKYIAYLEWSMTGELYSLSKQVQRVSRDVNELNIFPSRLLSFF